jgi:hypothetical protein
MFLLQCDRDEKNKAVQLFQPVDPEIQRAGLTVLGFIVAGPLEGQGQDDGLPLCEPGPRSDVEGEAPRM